MPKLSCLRELTPGESRVALTPTSAKKLTGLGIDCVIESGAGRFAGFTDIEYAEAGCRCVDRRDEALAGAEILVALHLPDGIEEAGLAEGATTISFLDPFRSTETIETLAASGLTCLSMEMIPRTTIAQKMDALSSQASLAGYAAVLLACMRLDMALPMMMTPAGTLQPARVFVVGVGVAGLQAIATAKRLGARVSAFDTRPVVKEQVESLGAKFVEIDLGETGQTAQGYAKELTPEQIERQQEGMAKACSQSDIIITTAQVFGRPAPRIINLAMLERMRGGSVVVDMAVSTGGNVEGSVPDREEVINGVRILGASNLPATVPRDASSVYANNISNLLEYFWKEEGGLTLDPTDEIAEAAVVTRGGKICNERVLANPKKN